jgi:predicted Rossmann fold flavoprotein
VNKLPVVVVGGGAAGWMAAIFAAHDGRAVELIERTKDGGRKILISGGGRCNVLPSRLSPAQYITASSPNTLKKMLLSWPLSEQRQFFEQTLGIPLALEQESGKLFPVSNRARDVRDGLKEYGMRKGVRVRFDTYVKDVQPHEDSWRVIIDGNDPIAASAVIMATGGLSVPSTGSEGTGLRIAKKLGHTINDTYPALTPLTCDPPKHADLAGVSFEVTLFADDFKTHGGFLFTHRGYSGPAVLDISHRAVLARMREQPQNIHVQWTERDTEAWQNVFKQTTTGTAGSLVRRNLPVRVADAMMAEAGVDPERAMSQLKKDERTRLIEVLARYELPWTGDEGYKKAEVTGGGVALAEVDPRTMQSRLHPGLFLCGEMLDAFGPIGGYNFAWAWATGRAAGLGTHYWM